jgi:GR25 family glycosyltransferase involved in LPS biosynthesis
MNYKGFYINLDKRPDRRREMEAELKRYNVDDLYSRFPAIIGSELRSPNDKLQDGEIGCFWSHYKLLEQNMADPQPLHVMEDDVIFSRYTRSLLETAVRNDFFGGFDLIFTDVFVPIDIETIKLYKDLYDKCSSISPGGERSFHDFKFVDLAALNFASTASFLVNRNSIAKLYSLFGQHLKSGIQLPIDLFIRQLTHEGKIRSACLFPFATGVKPESLATVGIADRYKSDLSVLVAFLLRYGFFVGCDWKKCFELFPSESLCEEDDEHRKLILSVIKFRLFGSYQMF